MQHRTSGIASLSFLALIGCGDYSAPSEVVNGVATVTLRAPSADFTAYNTFTVTDTVQISDNTTSVPKTYTKDVPQIVAEVRAQMESRGYTFVPFSQGTIAADLVIGLYALLGNQTYVSGGYYCDWFYWGYPYECYYGYGYAGSYNFGTLLMAMADVKNTPPPANGVRLPVLWTGANYGVLQSQGYDLNKLLAGIDKAFAQSPYIQR